MSLKCSYVRCPSLELAKASDIAFYQDLNTSGWGLALSPQHKVLQGLIPSTIELVTTGDPRFPFDAACVACKAKLGKVNAICGFTEPTLNFSAKRVNLVSSIHVTPMTQSAGKWAKVMDSFPQIQRIRPTVEQAAPIKGKETIHFHGVGELQAMIEHGHAVGVKANKTPRRYQWRAYFFACLNNTLLCLPTGMGKTLVANMLMKAYRMRNPDQAQVFVVPTVVLVEQQAAAIEQTTGMKVVRRSGEHETYRTVWAAGEICVCTYAMLVNAIKSKQTDLSLLSLLVLDEVHDASRPSSGYGQLLTYILKCPLSHRPRVLGLTASPSSVNTHEMRETIKELCNKIGSKPFSPLVDDSKNTDKGNDVDCQYISISVSQFEKIFEIVVFDLLEQLSQVHKYFAPNWKEIPINAEIKVKFNTVQKILSHARNYATNSQDVSLLQLVQCMSKWIGSLDMLQIVGPRKLLQYIKADLEFAERNDALSEISCSLAPYLRGAKEAIRKIEMSYVIPQDSERVTELLKILRLHLSDEERILIFVDRRDTAERLSRRLQEDPDVSKLNPDFVVGNSCSSKELQQEVLNKFRSGESRVIVATSVLEQGIDVAACGVVVCFDGVKSLKSIIQSRGRARKSKAKFIALVSESRQRATNELTQMEMLMNLAIKQLMVENDCTFEPQLAAGIDSFLELDEGFLSLPAMDEEEMDCDEEEPELGADLMLITLRFSMFGDAQALDEHISSFLNTPHDKIKVGRKNIEAKFALPIQDQFKAWQIVKDISTLHPDPSLRSWIDVHGLAHQDIQTANIDFDVLSGFHFDGATSVHIGKSPILSRKFKMTITKTRMKLKLDERQHFSLQPMDFDGPILINDRNDGYEVFLGLKNPPSFITNGVLDWFDFSATSFNLCLTRKRPVSVKESQLIRLALMNFSLEVYNVCHLRTYDYVTKVERNIGDPSSSDFFTKNYMIKAWHSKYAAALPPQLPDDVLAKFHRTQSVKALELLLDATVPIRFQRLKVPEITNVHLPFEEKKKISNYVPIGRVKVMPNRLVFMPLSLMQKNRVFRFFPNPENFLVITFLDERNKSPWKAPKVVERFLNLMIRGITVGGKQFTFLGASNSQMREGHCWFSCLDRQEVYAKIGEFDPNWTPGRKLTRIALAFAASIETVTLDHQLCIKHVQPDIEIDGVNFTDGIGYASPQLFEAIKKILNMKNFVSAFQIRVGGIKGVISMLDEGTSTDSATFRKSMKKFESDHNVLEVLNYSFPIPLFLNRHTVLMLSYFGVEDEVFKEYQFRDLREALEALIEDDKSLNYVQQRSTVFHWERFPKEHIVHEPFFRQIMESNAIERVSKIVNHAHISVPQGRVLMGTADETKTLDEGEIYVRVIENDMDLTLDGPVVVFRNPCVLPSDIRILNARRDVPSRMRNLYQNCAVFPTRGKSWHPHECAGGDLDGDLYYIIWDKKLIPKKFVSTVIEVEVQEMMTEDMRCTSDCDMMKYFCDNMAHSQLGVIANAHLATADKLSIMDPKAIELARHVVAETDAPKKGFSVGAIGKELMPTEYPDFMAKTDKKMYKSKTILGKLYRHAIPLLEVLLEKRVVRSPKMAYNFLEKKESVQHFYSLFSFEINKMMQMFEVEAEVDLFSGTPMWQKSFRSTYKQETQLRETIIENVREFWGKWEEIFEEWRNKNANSQELIQSWYMRPKSDPYPVHSFSWLAIPFVDFDTASSQTLGQLIRDSTLRWIANNKMKWMDEYRTRFNVAKLIIRKLGSIECHVYGSTALALNEEYSDVDLFADDSSMENLAKTLRDLDVNAESHRKPHQCVSMTYEALPIDVTKFAGGVTKTCSLASTFDNNPEIWTALRVLIEWARTVNIVKSGSSQGLMNVVSFSHLFIYFVTREPPKLIEARNPFTLARVNHWMACDNESRCGQHIYDFLKFVSERMNKAWIASKTDPISIEPLIKSELIGDLRRHAEIALYILAVHNGEIEKLFQFSSSKRLLRIDKRLMNPAKITEGNKKQVMIELKAKSKIKDDEDVLLEFIERNGTFYLEVSGNHKRFQTVENALNKMHSKVISVHLSLLSRQKCYHIRNSTILIAELGNGLSTEVTFATYQFSDYSHAQHIGKWKSVLDLRNSIPNHNWRLTERQRYISQFMQQIRLFRQKQNSAQRDSKAWRFFGEMKCSITPGFHYLFNIPETLHNTFETVTLRSVQKNICQYEETLSNEHTKTIIQEARNYNSHTLLRMEPGPMYSNAPLKVKPLNSMRLNAARLQKVEVTSTSNSKKSQGVRHTFYPVWLHGAEKCKLFALMNGFIQVAPSAEDFYTTISVNWRQRELAIDCTREGMIKDIHHRTARWFSSTIRRSGENSGDDLRTYLKTYASLDEDETCLTTIIEFLENRSVFSEEFKNQIENEIDGVEFVKRPLISEMFQLNWRLTSMRKVTPMAKFVNNQGDVVHLRKVNTGIFKMDTKEFEWFPNHVEVDIAMSLERPDEDLCEASWKINMALFDFTKK